jgi:hypothetical protein
MTLATLQTKVDALKAEGIDVTALSASDLFNPALDSDARNVLSLDLLRRRCERRAAELAAK